MPNRVDLVFPFFACLIRARRLRGAIFFQSGGKDFIYIFHRNKFQTLFGFFRNIDQIF